MATMNQVSNGSDPQDPVCHVIIIGEYLAGLATAIGLRKGGHIVTVLEQVPEFSKICKESRLLK